MLYVHQRISAGRKHSKSLGKPYVLHPILVEVLNLHIPSASTIILEIDFKTLAHGGLSSDQKFSEIIKACDRCLAPL